VRAQARVVNIRPYYVPPREIPKVEVLDPATLKQNLELYQKPRDYRNEEKTAIEYAFGTPKEQLKKRKALIYRPAKSATQNGYNGSDKWVLKFFVDDRWYNPLMGWTSSRDPLVDLSTILRFDTKETAVAYAEEQGYDYELDDEIHELRFNNRSYGSKLMYVPPPKYPSTF